MVIDIQKTEHRFRLYIRQKRIRLKDFFVDFDNLREGHVTKMQFQRCLDLAFKGLQPPLSVEESEKLVTKYLSSSIGMVCYRNFVENINQDFEAMVVDKPPHTQRHNSIPYLDSERSRIGFGPDVLIKVHDFLVRIAHYYHYRNLNVRSIYWDFDQTKSGFVLKDNFIRYFAAPPETTHNQLVMLANYYQDPNRANMCNYLNFRDDLDRIITELYYDDSWGPTKEVSNIDAYVCKHKKLAGALERTRQMVHKNGVRTTEFFKDHDKLNSGHITRPQFVACLHLCIGKEAQLKPDEVALVTDYYTTPRGLVNYKPFCDMMEHAYNVALLEKKPTIHPVQPPNGSLLRPHGQLTKEEDESFRQIMQYIRKEVKKRQLQMQPYFKDLDRSQGYTRIVNRSQFERILSFFNILPDRYYVNLLCRKFVEPASGDVNYPAFCQAVDENFVHHKVDEPEPLPRIEFVPPPAVILPDTSKVDMCDILCRIRHLVTERRIRVNEFFRDDDPLRSGYVSRSIFARCLQRMGVNWLDTVQVYAMQEKYASKEKPDLCSWIEFKHDVDYKIEPNDLDKHPTMKVAPLETHIMPKVGAVVDTAQLPKNQQWTLDHTMARMKARVLDRGINLKPIFQDFDHHKNGHVTKNQWRHVVSFFDVNADEQEFEAVRVRFSDDIGFDYSRFLAHLLPDEPDPLHVEPWNHYDNITIRKALNENRKPPELNPLSEMGQIFKKIKIVVANKRMRAHEFFKDYDKLRSGRILKVNFERALDLFNAGLKESEIKKLSEFFTAPKFPDFVSYWPFCDEVESVFTVKHLDKNPLFTPDQFETPVDWHCNEMSQHDTKQLKVGMNRIAKYVARNRTQLFPFFRDYDVTHNGHCSKPQFCRVLYELDLGKLVSDYEAKLICKRFEVLYGERRDVNYEAFCHKIYEWARFVPNNP